MGIVSYHETSGYWAVTPGAWCKISVTTADADAMVAARAAVRCDLSDDLLNRIPTTYPGAWQAT